MKVMITGIGGFVGPYLKECLELDGHEVFGFERTRGEPMQNIFYGDIRNPNDIERAISESQPEGIIHLAGLSSVPKSFEEPELCWQINVEGTKNLIQSSLLQQPRPRLLIISSAQIYGEPRYTPINEEHPLSPTSPYAKSRVAQEQLATTYQHDLEIIVSRSFNHTGPGQPADFVVADFAKQLIEIEKGLRPAEMKVGNMEAIRDFTDVRDMVRAYTIALKKGVPGAIYNICSGKGYKIEEILASLIRLSGIKVKIESDPERHRPSDIPVLIGSHEKFTKTTGWQPAIPFEQTLTDMLNWWRSHLQD